MVVDATHTCTSTRPLSATSATRADASSTSAASYCVLLKMREPVRRRFVTDLPWFRRLLIRQGGVSSHREISGNKNSYIQKLVYRAAHSATDEARKVSFRRKTYARPSMSTVDATHATHAWLTTHTRAHQRGRFLRPLLHAQTRLARALRLTASVYRHVYSRI